jgi:putative endonuclease
MKRLSAARPGIPYCYILQCADGSFYTGWTNDLARRFRQHQTGNGGRYTRAHCPVKLAYFEQQADASAARRREAEIKKLMRTKKAELIAGKLAKKTVRKKTIAPQSPPSAERAGGRKAR